MLSSGVVHLNMCPSRSRVPVCSFTDRLACIRSSLSAASRTGHWSRRNFILCKQVIRFAVHHLVQFVPRKAQRKTYALRSAHGDLQIDRCHPPPFRHHRETFPRYVLRATVMEGLGTDPENLVDIYATAAHVIRGRQPIRIRRI